MASHTVRETSTSRNQTTAHTLYSRKPSSSSSSSSASLLSSSDHLTSEPLRSSRLFPHAFSGRPIRSMPSLPKKEVNVFMGGYLFTDRTIALLCYHGYKIPKEEFHCYSPLSIASTHFHLSAAIDSPSFYPAFYRSPKDQNVILQGWILPVRMAIVSPDKERPALPLDEAAEKYADHWFPRHLRQREEFREVKYIERRWVPTEYRRTCPSIMLCSPYSLYLSKLMVSL